MKKFFLAFLLIFALSLPAYATDFTIISGTPSALYTLVSGDVSVTSDDFIQLTGVYEFTTIENALSFANDTKAYINNTYGLNLELAEDEAENFPDVALKLSASNIGSDAITFSNYGNVTTIEISPSGSSTMTLSTPGTASRHFYFDNSGATITLKNLILNGNSGVGGVSITNGTVNFDTVTFQNIDVSGSALNGGAAIISGGTANFSGCTFDANTASSGGAVYVSGGTATFDGTTSFTGNTATASGGAIDINGGTVTFSSSSTFSNNTAENGGAVYIDGGTVTLASGSTFNGNTANTSGGAILLNSSSTTLSITGAEFTSNTATNGEGGAIIVGTSGGTLNLTGCTFTNNKAANTTGTVGGAISLRGGSLTLDGSTKNSFSNNTANQEGGAIYINGASSVTFSGTNEFSTNTAGTNGGAIYLADINATLGGTLTFKSNTAATSGGAIYIDDLGIAEFTGTANFNSNKATNDSGGAIYANGSGRITAGDATMTFTSNSASQGSFSASGDPTSSDIPATGLGGAVCFAGSGNSTLGTATFDDNLALAGGAVASTGTGGVTFSSASFGTATANTAESGGAVYANGSGTLTFSTADFQKNTAVDHGGAIYVSANGKLKFTTSANFSDNHANTDAEDSGNGGAVYWGGTGSAFTTAFTSTNGITFTENSTLGSSTSSVGDGGAVYFAGTGTLTINSSTNITFDNNTAYNSGGAIAANTGNITIEGVTISYTNTASNGGGGFVYSAAGTVTLNNASISAQTAVNGGAIYALNVSISNSTLSENTVSTNGGAVYTSTGGTLTVNTSTFTDKNKALGNGGAVYADNSTVTIDDSLFTSNEATSNGGSSYFVNNCTSTITLSTFDDNAGMFGGAISSKGKIYIRKSYFTDNHALMRGGAVFFDQAGGEGHFEAEQSMFYGHTAGDGAAAGGQGGALHITADYAEIDSCTFDTNACTAGQNVRGGAVFLDTSGGISPSISLVENSTFTLNRAINGTTESIGGALYADGALRIRSCTLTLNNVATTKGGGLYIGSSGNITISGTLFVGNSAALGGDVWSDGTWTSMGYNRVGIYGTGSANASWIANPVPDSDKENKSWTTETFYSDNALDDNEIDDSKPPYIGSSLMEATQRLQTIMLKEDANLTASDRATNIIPYNLRFQFPEFDQRGAQRRRVVSGTGVPLDIGPLLFGGTWEPDEEPTNPYTIAYVQISGVPNSIRKIGQTASLIAKIYYTNGRTAYGGTGTGNEAVVWSATPAGYLKVNSETGVITAMRLTTGESYVTLTCQTVRTDETGNPSTATARIKIDPALEFGELNNSPESGNSDTVQIIRDLRYEFEEYNMGYGLIDKNIEIVQSYNYQDIISTIWGVDNAEAIATTASNYQVAASSTNALVYSVSVANVNKGAVTPPMTYLCSFTGEELKSILGYSLASSMLASDETPVDAATAAKIFSVLKIEFEGENGYALPILGPESSINVADAINKGALEVTYNNDQGIDIKINLMVANLASDSTALKITESSRSNLKGAVIIPDGADDGQISGEIIFPQKEITASESDNDSTETKTDENNQQTTPKTQTIKTASNAQESSSSGGGTGCNLVRSEELGVRGVLLFLTAMFMFASMKMKIRRG